MILVIMTKQFGNRGITLPANAAIAGMHKVWRIKKKNILHYRQRRKEWLSFEICNVHGQTKTKDAAGQQRYNQRQIDRLAISEQINQSKERKNTLDGDCARKGSEVFCCGIFKTSLKE